MAADSLRAPRGGPGAQGAGSDPKLVEAQELLARLALEDNNNAKATEEAKKALAIDPNSVGGKAILATIDWLADKKETQWDPHTAPGYEIAGHFFTLNRRYEEGIAYLPQGHRAGPAVVQRARRSRHQPDAPGPGRGGLQAAQDLLRQRLPEQGHHATR